MRVLFVDDDRDFLAMLQERCACRGIDAVIAHDGFSAVDYVRENLSSPRAQRLDLIVLDVLMPYMNGMETLAQLRDIAPGIPVILLTAHVALDDALRCLDAGAYDYLLKPLDIETLCKKMAEVVASAA